MGQLMDLFKNLGSGLLTWKLYTVQDIDAGLYNRMLDLKYNNNLIPKILYFLPKQVTSFLCLSYSLKAQYLLFSI